MIILLRCSHRRCSIKKGVLKHFTKCTGKYMFQSLFSNKVVGLRQPPMAASVCSKQPFTGVYRLAILKNIAKFTGKHKRWSTFYKIVADVGIFYLKRSGLHRRCFPVNLVKFFRTVFFMEHLRVIWTAIENQSHFKLVIFELLWRFSEAYSNPVEHLRWNYFLQK